MSTKEISKIESQEVVKPEKSMSVESLISQAVKANVSIETLERLLVMRDKFNAEKAKEAFVVAMSGFQSECPVIKKTKKVLNKDGRTVRYSYAPIESIVEQIKKPLSKYKLSYSWEAKNEPGSIVAVVTITHALGHSTTSEFKIPVDTEGYMTAPQKVASALTFAKRYSLCNALGISTGDEDTDAIDTNKEKEAKSTKSKVIFLLRSLNKKTDTKEEIEAAVKSLAKLDLIEENLNEIVSRLEILVQENHENKNIR